MTKETGRCGCCFPGISVFLCRFVLFNKSGSLNPNPTVTASCFLAGFFPFYKRLYKSEHVLCQYSSGLGFSSFKYQRPGGRSLGDRQACFPHPCQERGARSRALVLIKPRCKGPRGERPGRWWWWGLPGARRGRAYPQPWAGVGEGRRGKVAPPITTVQFHSIQHVFIEHPLCAKPYAGI